MDDKVIHDLAMLWLKLKGISPSNPAELKTYYLKAVEELKNSSEVVLSPEDEKIGFLPR